MHTVLNVAPHHLLRKLLISEDRKRAISLEDRLPHMCRDEITYSYIRTTINRFDEGFIYTDPVTDNPVGICLWHVTNETPKRMHIRLVCYMEKGFLFGNRVFMDVIQYCRENGIQRISLTTNKEKLYRYYESYGFRRNNAKNKYTMILDINDIPVIRNRSSKRKTYKSREIRRRTTRKVRPRKNVPKHSNNTGQWSSVTANNTLSPH